MDLSPIEAKAHLLENLFGIIRNRPDGIRILESVLKNLSELAKLKEKYRK